MLGCVRHTLMKCGKCLLSEYDPKFYTESIAEYISLIPEDKKTPPDEYRRRLGICVSCPSLMDGMCGECGCFAEIRAAKAYMHCPLSEDRW